MRAIFTTVIGLILLNATVAFGQIGGLDTTFGQGGKVETYINDVSEANAEALQSDGKIVVAGFTYDSIRYVFATVRYNADGSVDSTFGVEGVDTISFQNGNNYATSIAIQNNGKIVVAGYSVAHLVGNDSVIIISLVRYDTTGAIDTTFGTKGKVTTLFGSINDQVHAIAIQNDGKIVATGSTAISSSKSKLIIIRYTATGSLDSSFNHTAIVDTIIGTTASGNAMVILPNSKILIAGTADIGQNNFILLRYDTNGLLDKVFGTNGVTATTTARGLNVNSIALQKDGKIIVGGYAATNRYNAFALARYDTAGIQDDSFGISGTALTTVGTLNAQINSIVVDTAGKIVAAGFSYDAATKLDDFTVLRYDSSGRSIDTTFGDTGKAINGFGSAESFAQSVLIQPNGKIVVAGYALVGTKGLFALTRYDIDTSSKDTSTGVVEAAIENGSLFLYPNPASDEAVLKYTLTTNETLTINIYDVAGRLVEPVVANKNRRAGNYEELLNLDALQSGFYILNLSSANSESLSIKILKE